MDEWISVAERLPNTDSEVLFVLSGNNRLICKGDWDGECFIDEIEDNFDEHYRWSTVEVTHWMPLPSPPKEQDVIRLPI